MLEDDTPGDNWVAPPCVAAACPLKRGECPLGILGPAVEGLPRGEDCRRTTKGILGLDRLDAPCPVVAASAALRYV